MRNNNHGINHLHMSVVLVALIMSIASSAAAQTQAGSEQADTFDEGAFTMVPIRKPLEWERFLRRCRVSIELNPFDFAKKEPNAAGYCSGFIESKLLRLNESRNITLRQRAYANPHFEFNIVDEVMKTLRSPSFANNGYDHRGIIAKYNTVEQLLDYVIDNILYMKDDK
ncbi:hypothetical protein [Sphingomonas rustica]